MARIPRRNIEINAKNITVITSVNRDSLAGDAALYLSSDESLDPMRAFKLANAVLFGPAGAAMTGDRDYTRKRIEEARRTFDRWMESALAEACDGKPDGLYRDVRPIPDLRDSGRLENQSTDEYDDGEEEL